MAAVTGPGSVQQPPGIRRRWLIAIAVVWALVLLAAVFWSADHDPATVPEQRDVGQAVPEVRRATGAVMAAAGDPRWVVRLGALRVERCSLNPAWKGGRVSREVTVYVPEGEARAALDGIAQRLPKDYQAGVAAVRGGTQLSLAADAGELITVDVEAKATDQVLIVRVDSGCRPPGEATDAGDPPAGATPAIVRGLGVEPDVVSVTCPGGGTAATFEAEGGAADPASEPTGLPAGTSPVWAEPGGWAYRMGSDSVVVSTEGGRLVTSVTTGCG